MAKSKQFLSKFESVYSHLKNNNFQYWVKVLLAYKTKSVWDLGVGGGGLRNDHTINLQNNQTFK